MAKPTRQQLWSWSKRVFGILILVAVGAGAWFGDRLYQRMTPRTTGAIYVSGPQVYTRERLVNDRYREDAWLLNRLNTEETFGITESVTRKHAYEVGLTGSVGKEDAAAAGDAKKTDAADKSADKFEATPFDKFHAALTYREQIRTLIIENQLDDRHDLRGNSLYRLRFDAAVLPGNNTHSSARVSVSVLPPEGLLNTALTDSTNNTDLRNEEAKLASLTNLAQLSAGEQKKVWERIYLRWLDSLGKRFEDGRKALRTAYDTDRFAPSDYDLLLNSVVAAVGADYDRIVALRARSPGARIPGGLPAVSGEVLEKLGKSKDDMTAIPPHDKEVMRKFQADYSHGNAGDTDAESHKVYKAEIDRLIDIMRQARTVRTALELAQNAQAPPPAPATAAGAPVAPPADDGCGDLKTYGSYGSLPPSYVDVTLNYFLDVAFEGNLAKSILGLQPELSSSEDGATTLNSITSLIPLAVVEAHYGARGPAFTFKRQVAPLVVTDRRACFPQSLENSIDDSDVQGHRVYVLNGDVSHIKFLVPDYDLQSELVPLVKDWPVPLPQDKAHVVTEIVDAGLINFIRAAGRRLDAFSYAFTPSEPDELAATRSLDEQNRTLAAQAAGGMSGAVGNGGLKVSDEAALERNRNALRKMVVPFGDQSSSAIATFGWVIQPQEPIEGVDSYRQRASQTSLTALISLPAWWEEIRLRVVRSWVSESGDADQTLGTAQDYTIELPVNFETVDASLFETNDRSPVINEWATEGVIVRPCVRADIVIPGRRLWRSTVVMLGSQKADEIFVLPDMNGIVATFNPVLFPSTWSKLDSDFKVPLTVWTSQGSTSLPVPARFHALGPDAKTDCPSSPASPDHPRPAAQATAR